MELRSVLRRRLPEFHSFGIPLLVTQIQDPWPEIQKSALLILHEACNIPANVERFAKELPPLNALDDILFMKFREEKKSLVFLEVGLCF